VIPRDGLAQHDVFLELHARLLRAYRPRRYAGRTVVVASPRWFDLTAGWLDVLLPPESAGGLRHDVKVHGEHLDLVREPNVAEVARALEPLLDRAWLDQAWLDQTWQAEQ
jgi:hypothetical protein